MQKIKIKKIFLVKSTLKYNDDAFCTLKFFSLILTMPNKRTKTCSFPLDMCVVQMILSVNNNDLYCINSDLKFQIIHLKKN